jgi:uncharacterized protein (DUF924 family)
VTDWAGDVLAYWFGLDPARWWTADPELDAEIAERFEELWGAERHRVPEEFLATPDDALAAVILFDQVPRHLFRGHAESFATDPLALAVAKGAIDKGLDEQLSGNRRAFLYMPFQHSELLDDQERSLLLFTALGDADMLRYAKLHHDVIARFGRFPHRNRMLGRAPRPDEVAAGEVVPW